MVLATEQLAVLPSHPQATEPPRLLNRVLEAIRARHDSRRTEEACAGWIRRFILFHNQRHPAGIGLPEINQFLTHIAVRKDVAASTRTQSLSTLLFLYHAVREKGLKRIAFRILLIAHGICCWGSALAPEEAWGLDLRLTKLSDTSAARAGHISTPRCWQRLEAASARWLDCLQAIERFTAHNRSSKTIIDLTTTG
jgi:hypothetical protein